jgi:hypothetical protein
MLSFESRELQRKLASVISTILLSSATEYAMGLDITAYSQITLVEIVQDEEAWQQTYGAAYEDDDAEGPPLVFLSADFPFPDRLKPLAVPPTGIAVYQATGDTFAFRGGPYSYYNRWRQQLSLLVTGLPPHQLWNARDLAETRRLPFYLLIDFSDCEGAIGPWAAQVLARQFAQFQTQADAYDDDDFRELYADFRRGFELVGDAGIMVFH